MEKRFREDAVVAALEGRNDGEITFREAQTVSEIRSEVARFGTVQDSRAEQLDVGLLPAYI
jgi:hypothetical protein